MKEIISCTLLITFLSCLVVAQDIKLIEEKPFVLGTTHTIQSVELAERRKLNIYLPPGYSKDLKASYPVIYLLDGSKDEDFIHIAGLMQFANFPWVNLLPETILVGIGNVDRRRDFSYPTTVENDKKAYPTTGGSAKFIKFIEKELQPFINKKYRTNSHRTIIGQSFGGLLATEILFKKPELFERFIIISPSLWWGNQSLLSVERKPLSGQHSVYVAVGKEGKVMEKTARQLHKMLEEKKKGRQKIYFKYLPREDHGTILHRAVYHAFESFMPKKENSK